MSVCARGRTGFHCNLVEPFAVLYASLTVELARVCAEAGYPTSIRVDQGSEFISRELDLWAYGKGVAIDFSRSGRPTDNACIESFDGTFRAERLYAHRFMILIDAARKCEAWRIDYNEVRPYSAIGDKPPILLLSASVAHGPP